MVLWDPIFFLTYEAIVVGEFYQQIITTSSNPFAYSFT